MNHEHFLFKYYIIGYGESDDYGGYVKNFLKNKAKDYLGQKIKEEKKYYNNIKKL